jgi:hypothetical protein
MFRDQLFAKCLTLIAFAYVVFCSLLEVKDAIAYIGFVISLATLWANPPGKNSDSRDTRF